VLTISLAAAPSAERSISPDRMASGILEQTRFFGPDSSIADEVAVVQTANGRVQCDTV
jgi:hypothetical protein